MKKITLTIDGQTVTVPEGTPLLQAAREIGIAIPTLCFHDQLKPYGACRFCVVEVVKEGRSRLVASCVYPAEQGIEVKSETEKTRKTRKMILELLLPSVPVGVLRDLASRYGIEKSRFQTDEEPSYCTLCGLCVRYCDEVAGKDAIGFTERGVNRRVTTVPDNQDTCVFCRKCHDLCEGGRFAKIGGG